MHIFNLFPSKTLQFLFENFQIFPKICTLRTQFQTGSAAPDNGKIPVRYSMNLSRILIHLSQGRRKLFEIGSAMYIFLEKFGNFQIKIASF